ncbi:hypothetical protein KA005_29850, partial [bacterium]|nr:hypothetical protein [bacterium]
MSKSVRAYLHVSHRFPIRRIRCPGGENREGSLPTPRIKAISFRTFRHWGATKIYHATHGKLLIVQSLLGHKSILNTLKYIHLGNFKDDEYDVDTATTVE